MRFSLNHLQNHEVVFKTVFNFFIFFRVFIENVFFFFSEIYYIDNFVINLRVCSENHLLSVLSTVNKLTHPVKAWERSKNITFIFSPFSDCFFFFFFQFLIIFKIEHSHCNLLQSCLSKGKTFFPQNFFFFQ